MAAWCGRRPFDWSAMARTRRTVFRKRFWKPSKSRAGSRWRDWSALLRHLATVRAIDLLRVRCRHRGRMDAGGGSDEAVSREANPAQEAEASELAERLRAALPHLSQDQAAVFCLSCLENLSYQRDRRTPGNDGQCRRCDIAPRPASVKRAFDFGRYRNKRRRTEGAYTWKIGRTELAAICSTVPRRRCAACRFRRGRRRRRSVACWMPVWNCMSFRFPSGRRCSGQAE